MSKRPVGFMETGVFEIILRELKTVAIDLVGLHTIGEPFMYKNLEELLRIAEKKGFNVWLSTNGQFPERIEQLHKSIPSMANNYRFSIDGATRQTYESIRRGASFEKLIDSLEVINKINKGKINRRISILINSILTMTNIYEIPLYFDVFGKYCWHEDIHFTIVDGLSPDPSFFQKDFPFLNLIQRNVPCHMPFQSAYFTYDGKVTLCCGDYEADVVVGDIQKNTLIDIWNSAEAEDIRRLHNEAEKMADLPCDKCFVPYKSVSSIVNSYIHFLRIRQPKISPREFGDRLINLLSDMNSSIIEKDSEYFKKRVSDAFNSCKV